MIETVLRVWMILLSFTAHPHDSESPEAREDRLLDVAVAMVMSADLATCSGDYATPQCKRIWPGSRKELLAAQLTFGRHETRYAEHVQAGRCGEYARRECDRKRTAAGYVYTSQTYYQLKESRLGGAGFESVVGLESEAVLNATWSATKALAGARNQCAAHGDWAEGMFSNLATGSSCRWSGSVERARTLRSVFSVL